MIQEYSSDDDSMDEASTDTKMSQGEQSNIFVDPPNIEYANLVDKMFSSCSFGKYNKSSDSYSMMIQTKKTKRRSPSTLDKLERGTQSNKKTKRK